MLIDGNMIMSGFVSKGVNNLVDFGWKKIKDANSDRKSHEQNIETRIYQVIVDAINVFTFNEYKDQDILYYVVECIFKGFKEGKKYIEAVKMGLKILESQITDDRCQDFLGTLCDEICKDKNDILYKEINLIQNEEIIDNVHEGFKRSEKNQEQMREDIHKGFKESEQNLQEAQRKLDYLVEKAGGKDDNKYSETRVQNRAEEYAAKWDKNVFLNNFNKRDKNAGKNIKLKDLYLEGQLPHYIWKTDNESLSDLKDLLREYTVDNDGKNMLLILGQAGIGKSTLITWIMANFIEKKDDFFVYQFASDLKCVNWQMDNILSQIFKMLNLKYNELENKVLILDGFDEIDTSSGREKILNNLNQEIASINVLKNFSLIITCRENYVYEFEKIECNFITLQTWDDIQIKSFCDIFGTVGKNTTSQININKLLENKEIFGVPLILYMVLALDITIEKSETRVDVYDQIFSIDRSSIYDRCIENARYGAEHRISEDKIKQAIHQVSQRIAFWIFENNSAKEYISKGEYEKICDTVISGYTDGNESIKRDFLIGNYFKLINHCDGVGTQELHFIHRSIYEYFVVVYFYESLYNLSYIEELAGQLGELLKKGHLTQQILEFIRYKFDKITQYCLSDVTRETFQLMLRNDMTYHMKGKYKNIIDREMNIFANMLEVVHLWNPKLSEFDDKLIFYLRYNYITDLNLQAINLIGADLRGANLIGADLRQANLRGANLRGADLIGADLRGVKLIGADLRRADLRGADLRGAYLRGADLTGADLSATYLRGENLRGADLSQADLIGADLRRAYLSGTVFDENQVYMLREKCDLSEIKVFIFETGEVISYIVYRNRK